MTAMFGLASADPNPEPAPILKKLFKKLFKKGKKVSHYRPRYYQPQPVYHYGGYGGGYGGFGGGLKKKKFG